MATRLFSRSPSRDVLSINRDNRHQYYKTVQSEVHPHEQLDQAMARRQSRARAAAWRRRSRSARWPWLGALLLLMLVGSAWVYL